LFDVISEDQIAILSMCYILDNILVTHETIEWAKESNQDIILLKLNFMKAYDTMYLPLLWGVMHARSSQIIYTDLSIALCRSRSVNEH